MDLQVRLKIHSCLKPLRVHISDYEAFTGREFSSPSGCCTFFKNTKSIEFNFT